MKLIRAHADGARCAPRSGTFTGDVWGDPMSSQDGVTMNTVYFAPGARSYWHSHPGGQALHVSTGAGWVGARGEEPERVRAGDTVWTPPDEVHWHGAADDAFMAHIAISLGTTNWLEEVAAADYQTGEPTDGRR